MDEDLIDALDELREIMADEGALPSRSKIARDLLWAGIAIVRSKDPRAAELLKSLSNAETN